MLKTNRGVIKFIFLTIITLGLYPLFFYHGYARDVNAVCAGDGHHTYGVIALILLSLITLGIYFYVWEYSTQNRLKRAGQMKYSTHISHGGSTIVMWDIFGLLIVIGPFVAKYIQCNTLNQLAYQYNTTANSVVNRGSAGININVNTK